MPISNIDASCKLLEKRFAQIRTSTSNDDTFYTTGLSTIVYRDMFIHLSIDTTKKVLILSTSFMSFGSGKFVKASERPQRIRSFNQLPNVNRGCNLEQSEDGTLQLSKEAPMTCLHSNLDFEAVFAGFLVAARAARRIAQ